MRAFHLFLLSLVVLLAPAAAQQPVVRAYISAPHDSTLSSTARSVTIQMPAAITTSVNTVRGMIFSVSSENACDVIVSRDGTAATATAGTAVAVSSLTPQGQTTDAATATVWTQSNAGAGTTLSVVPIPAGVPVAFDIGDIRLQGAGTAKNFTIKTSAVSGRVVIQVKWQEY